MFRIRRHAAFAAFFCLLLLDFSCGGGSAPPPPQPPAIGVTLAASALTIFQGAESQTVNVTISRPAGVTGAVTLTTSGLPAGVTALVESPGTGNTGGVTYSAAPGKGGAGTFLTLVRASSGGSSGSARLDLIVGIVATVGASVAGSLDTFMSTSFQPASWSDQFFVHYPGATTPLDELNPQHINVQVLDRDIPQKSRATPTSAGAWDFTYIDGILNPIFTVADHSPLYQIAMGPAFMYNAGNPQMGFEDATYQEFAGYCARLVEYYNAGGFTDGNGVSHVSPYYPNWPITYWGIYNEPNINGFSPDEYVKMYNAVVPAMKAVDPGIKLVAVELSDWGNEPQRYLPTFVNNVTAPVDVVATHYYSSCNQKDTDQVVFDTIPVFVSHIEYISAELGGNPQLADVPVWVTENNVNADWSNNGTSVCNGTPFVTDRRGTSAFFAAWRPLLFSRLAQAGARSLHHWGFHADQQYGEVDGATAQPYLSYWVDFWLARYFPSPAGSEMLQLDSSDDATVEVLATLRGSDNTYVIMIANHAVASSADNNGAGAPRTVRLDLSALGTLSSGSQRTLDARTDVASGPAAQPVTPAPRIEITLPGYGVTFLELK